MYNQGDTVLIEVENGHRIEAEVVEYFNDPIPDDCPPSHESLYDEYMLVDMQVHPARDDVGRAVVEIENKCVYIPPNHKKLGLEGVWSFNGV